MHLIKKYPNRRLYDTQNSNYITLSDVKNLVLAFTPFQVVDAKSGEDLTRSILLQIILEEESGGVPLFSTDLLAQMIRFYGQAMQGALGKYLESNIKVFADFQQQMQEQTRALGSTPPAASGDLWGQLMQFQQPAMQSVMSAYMDQSTKLLNDMHEQIQHQARAIFSTDTAA
ncbi:MAG: polyhydroxyalkanoate synthesis repressor PhaR [Zoogloeaceae bacterium]|nr:polyhydroxyalkanoate synthesis repressor PhaR [Zoogloeaceae bacterium]